MNPNPSETASTESTTCIPKFNKTNTGISSCSNNSCDSTLCERIQINSETDNSVESQAGINMNGIRDEPDNSFNIAKGFKYWIRTSEFGNPNNLDYDSQSQNIHHEIYSYNNSNTVDDLSECIGNDICIDTYGNFNHKPTDYVQTDTTDASGNFNINEFSPDSNVRDWFNDIDSCGWTMKFSGSDNSQIDRIKNNYARQCNRLFWKSDDINSSNQNDIYGGNLFPRNTELTLDDPRYVNYQGVIYGNNLNSVDSFIKYEYDNTNQGHLLNFINMKI